MEKKKKKQFIRPTVRLLEDVEALPLLAGSDPEDSGAIVSLTMGGTDVASNDSDGAGVFRGGF